MKRGRRQSAARGLPGILFLTALGVACRGSAAEQEPVPERYPTSPELGQRAYRHVRNLVAMGARSVGTPGWARAIDYIAQELAETGVEVERDRWRDEGEDMVFENIIGRIPGSRRERIVIGAHHDTKCTQGHEESRFNFHFVGANDSGSGVGLLLALAGELAGKDLGPTLEFVFFDGEESIPYDWDIDRALFGSRRYVKRYEEDRMLGRGGGPIRAFILLDMVGAEDLQIDDESNSDARLQKIIAAAARAHGHQKIFFKTPYTVTDDHIPFLDAGIPSVDLIDLKNNPEWHTARDTLAIISARSLQIVGETVLTALPGIIEAFAPAPAGSTGDRKR